MIKLTNAQAAAINTDIIAKLFNDNSRQFPITDAFKLADVLQEIQKRLKVYYVKQKEIIESHGGKIHENGAVTYPKPEDQLRAAQGIAELNSIELEYPGSKLQMTHEWPKLSLAEATVLRPLVAVDLGSQEDKQCQTIQSKKSEEAA